MNKLLFLILLFSYSIVFTKEYNVFIQDISLIQNFSAKDASFYGLKLGFSKDTCYKILKSKENQITFENEFDQNRIRIYDKTKTGEKNKDIIILKFDKQNNILFEVSFLPTAKKYFKGKSKDLFTSAVYDSQSDIRKKFLGYPDSEKITGSFQEMIFKEYMYNEKWIVIHRQEISYKVTTVLKFRYNLGE